MMALGSGISPINRIVDGSEGKESHNGSGPRIQGEGGSRLRDCKISEEKSKEEAMGRRTGKENRGSPDCCSKIEKVSGKGEKGNCLGSFAERRVQPKKTAYRHSGIRGKGLLGT